MAIKLIKACKELNIGMTVAAEFCRIQGVEIPTDPNARLTDEMFLALAREFNKDMALKLEAERQSHERFERVMHVAENILPTTTEETHDDGVFRLGKPTLNSKPRVVGSISLDDKVSSGTPKVGDIIEGVVKSIKDFGVFVDCGFMDGLVHISELAENPNVKPQQVVKIRQKVRVKVLKIFELCKSFLHFCQKSQTFYLRICQNPQTFQYRICQKSPIFYPRLIA